MMITMRPGALREPIDAVTTEVDQAPAHAISDHKQSLAPDASAKMVKRIKALAAAVYVGCAT